MGRFSEVSKITLLLMGGLRLVPVPEDPPDLCFKHHAALQLH